MKLELKLISIVLVVNTITTVLAIYNEDSKNLREEFIHYYKEWGCFGIQVMADIGPSCRIEPYLEKIYAHGAFHAIINLGPKVVPYIFAISDNILIPAVEKICKVRIHRQYIRDPQLIPGKDVQITFEEFPDILTEIRRWCPGEEWLRWWLEGEKRTPQWFIERYSKWRSLKLKGAREEAQVVYQKLLDIGIAAIPLWLQKLQTEQDKRIRQSILEALAYLTDGEVKATMSVQNCLNWWRENKERWTIPFPKSKKAFLEWLEKEGWEEPRLTVPCVITISRLEEEEAIEALLRFLRHPSPLVRAVSLEQIMKLFGEQLPKEYALGVGTDEWEIYGDLLDIGKADLVRKRMMEAIGKVEDKKQAKKVADDLSNWWQSKKGKVTIYWRRAWENL